MGKDISWNDDIIEPISGDDVMMFGKYKGEKIDDVPAQYLIWLHEQDWFPRKFPELESYISSVWDVLDEQVFEEKTPDIDFYCPENVPF